MRITKIIFKGGRRKKWHNFIYNTSLCITFFYFFPFSNVHWAVMYCTVHIFLPCTVPYSTVLHCTEPTSSDDLITP